MGEVFLAEHTYTGQKVALKAVWPNLMASEGPRKRFLQEGRVLAALSHPNIVGLTDFFEEDGRFFLAMQYIEGHTLASQLDSNGKSGRVMPVEDAVAILKGILAGVAHAHGQGSPVVHRDIKPSNVMLAKDGRVVLMDFGIAKVAEGEKITRTAGVVGTYEYMSPEQVTGQGITPATDVYAVGIVAYELLTGGVPFPQTSDSGYEAMEGHKTKMPPPIQYQRPDCPGWLVGWVEKALAKVPRDRFADAGEMLAALERKERAGEAKSLVYAPSLPVSPPARPPVLADGGGSNPSNQLSANSGEVTDVPSGGGTGIWIGVIVTVVVVAGIGLATKKFFSGVVEQPAAASNLEEKRDETKKEEARPIELSASAYAGLQWVYSAPAKLDFAKTETTVSQYRACVEAGACSKENHSTKSDTSYCNWGHSERDDHPMNCVNWHGATQFCAWVGGRLPTEDEWYAEASNGGSRQYPWGDTEVTCDRAIWGDGKNTDGCGKDSTWPVCSKTTGNSFSGLCDMSGNVWEWTSTPEGSERVLRGGSWGNDGSTYLRASGRYGDDPGVRLYTVGVRCVRVSQ